MKKDAYDYIDVMAGSADGLFPVAAYPRGMAAFSLQTAPDKEAEFFDVSGECRGIRLTHCISYEAGDFGDITIMPQSGELKAGDERRSKVEELVFRPDKISGVLVLYETHFTLVPGVHGCFLRLKFMRGGEKHRVLILGDKLKLATGGRVVAGTSEAGVERMLHPLKEYLHFLFDTDFGFSRVDGGYAVEFDADEVEMRLATSFISHEQALLIRTREYDARESESAGKDCRHVWNHYLGRVTVSAYGAKKEKRKRLFYTCLYRVLLASRRFYEASPEHTPIHIGLKDGKIKSGVQYAGCEFSKCVRTVLPLLSVVAPDDYVDIVLGINESAKDLGYLPQGMLPYDDMYSAGVPVEQIFCDAVVKCAVDERKTIELLHAVKESVLNTRGVSEYGRAGAAFYNLHGYLPFESVSGSVRETLEYCFGDYAFTKAAAKAGFLSVYGFRSCGEKNYLNLFDGETGKFRARGMDGKFLASTQESDFGEGGENACEFNVCHDMTGLRAVKKDWKQGLEELLLPKLDARGTVASVNAGSIFLSPATLHLPYIYAETGDRSRTENIVRAAVDSAAEKGAPIGEDGSGAVAAWYVLACLGLYPFCIGRGDYLVTDPLFDKIRIVTEGIDLTLTSGKARPKRVAHGELRTLRVL